MTSDSTFTPQDGGLLVNNPTAVALHESQCLWPGTRLQCVVSLGTGRLESSGRYSATYTSLKTKLSHVISSATDTEGGWAFLPSLITQSRAQLYYSKTN